MIYYTKNGSIPYPFTDNTEGWVEAPAPPECPEGKQLVWLNYEWIVRDPKPQDREGYQWNWQHDTRSWVEGAYPTLPPLTTQQIEALTTTQVDAFTTTQIAGF